MENGFFHQFRNRVKNWWVSLIAGILAVILGLWCVITPDVTLVALTFIFIAAFFIGGLFEILFAVSNRKIMYGWGWTLTGGIFEVLLGLLLLAMPLPVITTILVYLVGFWVLLRSVWLIGQSVEAQMLGIKGWGWLLVFGIVCVLLSLLYLLSPIFNGVVMVVFVCIALVIYGIVRVYMGFELRSLHKKLKEFEE